MKLDLVVRDYPAYVDELVGAINKPETRIYLDTSLLMWLIRVGSDARREFRDWCTARTASSVRVPVWAAHELHRHVVGGTVRAGVFSILGEAQKRYTEFSDMAVERADDGTCRLRGYAGRSSYIGELEKSAALLESLSRVVRPMDDALREASQEVVEFVNERLLQSDLTPAIRELGTTGAFRASHRMPPGFEDKKEENAFGDAIIWEEIVQDLISAKSAVSGSLDAIIVSRDKKKDWVSSAPAIRNNFGGIQAPEHDRSLDVALPHPLLIHDFTTRARGGSLYVVHPAFLAAALHRDARKEKGRSPVQHWLAASHRPEFLANLNDEEKTKNMQSPQSPEASTPAVDKGAPPSRGAPSDAASSGGAAGDFAGETPSSIMGLDVSADVRGLMDALPREQAALVDDLVQRLVGGGLTSLKFGRVLAQISLEGAIGWPEQIPALLERLASKLRVSDVSAVALGVIVPIYFDRYGEPLSRPVTSLAVVGLSLLSTTGVDAAFRCLKRFISEADIKLPYVPGAQKRNVQYNVTTVAGSERAPRVLRDIRIGQHPVLLDSVPHSSNRRLSILLRRSESQGCSGLELRSLLGLEYLIPVDALTNEYDQKRFTWTADSGLVVMDTGVDGGLSALADEEDDK